MKITGISGSPNVGGNNEKLIDMVLCIAEERGFETDRILLSKLNVSPCNDCGICRKEKYCPIEDDMAVINEKLEASDAIIVSSPVYFGSVTAQIKALFDRSILLRRNGFLLKGKVGGAIAVGHPLGASGARLALTAARQLQRTGGRYALVSLCIGGGQGMAAILERV